MYKHKQVLLIILFLFCTYLSDFAQITATPSFTGCAPYSVVLSGPSGASSVFWNLGTGIGTTTLSSPNPIYTSPGNYNITYTAIVGGSPVTYNAVVTVKQPPSGNLSASIPASHCAPLTVNFTAAGGAPGNTYSWNFGDLSVLGSGPTVSHTYGSSNSFVPVLFVIDAVSGCTAVANSNVTVQVSAIPFINITSSNGYVACSPPFVTNINGSNSSSGSPLGGGLTYNWQFNTGNPASSSAATPGSVSFNAGQHSIILSVTDNNQCSASQTVFVSVVTPTLSAIIAPTVCINVAVPVTISTNQGNVLFNIPGGVPNSPNIQTQPGQTLVVDTLCYFTTPGLHNVIASVQTPGCASVTKTIPVFVEEVIASFTWTPPEYICSPTLIATYINQSSVNNSSSLSFTWSATSPTNNSHYGVPTQSVINGLGSPTFTFYQGSVNPYTIYQYFTPNITLNVQSNSAAQCRAHIVNTPYTIVRPTAWFFMDKKMGCAPLTVTLTDFSYTKLPEFPIASYTWCNGATPPTFSTGLGSTIPNSVFTYTDVGVYKPYLIIQTAGGCTDMSYFDTVTVVNSPTVSATFPATVCAGKPFTVNMSGTLTPGISTATVMEHWHVNTDKEFFSGCVTNSSPTFSLTHVGSHSVIVTAYQAGCAGTSTMTQMVLVKGPVGKFRFETTCTGNKKIVKFYVHLQEASSAILSYGDLTQQVVTGNASGITTAVYTHTYATTGDFNAVLTSSNSTSGCLPYTSKQTVKIREPKAIITYGGLPLPSLPNALACTKSPYKFSAASSIDAEISCGSGQTWFFEATTHTLAPLIKSSGSFTTTYAYPPGPPPATLTACVDPVALDTFRYAGTYTIGLLIKDVNSCVDTVRRVFRISAAKPVFSFAANPICLSGGTLQVNNTTPATMVPPDAITSYTWNFGDGNPSIISTNPNFNPSYIYSQASVPSQTFAVMCIATNNKGCQDTTIHTVQVNNPKPNFIANKLYPCLPKNQSAIVNFSANTGYATYSVTYGDPPSFPSWGTSSNFTGAYHSYSTPGTYKAKLNIIDNAGCKASDSLNIIATGQPTAVILFSDPKSSYCRPALNILSLSNSSINVTPITNFIWTIGSISSPAPGSSTLINNYTAPSTTVFLTVSIGSVFLCPHTASAVVITTDPSASAIINPTVFCLGDNIEASIKIEKDVYAWKWFYGDFVAQPIRYNTPATPTTVTYPYTTFPTSSTTGTNIVTLVSYGSSDLDAGCAPSTTIAIRVIKIQSDFKHLLDNYRHCLKIPDTFTTTSVNFSDLNLSYEWNFGNQDTAKGESPTYTYPLPGTYTVGLTVRDVDHNCTALAVKNITILPLPTATISSVETTCANTPFLIQGQANPGVSGPVSGTLIPTVTSTSLAFTSSNTFTVNGTLAQTSTLALVVTDTNKCENRSGSINIKVQPAAPAIKWDTTIVIGQTAQLNAFVGSGFTYTWSQPAPYLNCETCLIFNPVSSATTSITYSVMVEDSLHCSVVANTYRVNVEVKVSIDVPTAFTPNGDGINDAIFPNGWGLKKLNYFKVFNRWGQLVFESNDLSVGWNGIFNGVPQNMETYVYQVSAQTYLDSQPIISKTGTFKLLR